MFSNKKQFERTKCQIVLWVFVCVLGLENWKTRSGQIVLWVFVCVFGFEKLKKVKLFCAPLLFFGFGKHYWSRRSGTSNREYTYIWRARGSDAKLPKVAAPFPPMGWVPILPPLIRLTIQAES